MSSSRVLALLPLLVGLTHCFSWDIVMAGDKRIEFYYNGKLTHAQDIPAATDITAIKYDAVHDRVLFANYYYPNASIYSFDISASNIQPVVTRTTSHRIHSIAYDPVTQLLFWKEEYNKIYSFIVKPESSNKTVDGKLFVTLDYLIRDIAVDSSCGGFIYWITDREIGRAAFDGSKREILVNDHVFSRRSLAIDQQTQRMYWIEETTYKNYSIKSADLNGKNTVTFYSIGSELLAYSLAVSEDFIYWWSINQKAFLQLKKCQQCGAGPISYLKSSASHWFQLIAAKYTIQEQTLGIQGCETLKNTSSNINNTNNMGVSAENYSSTCHNYCIHGNCSVSTEGQPKCSCYNGYSGLRCEVNACHMYCLNDGVCSLSEVEKPVCQCKGDYRGERCDVSICKDYCMQGHCSVSIEGQPTCRCTAGYSGERCEVITCQGYCLNNGDCFLSEEDEPVCQCSAGYEGDRCDVATSHDDVCICADKMTQQILRDLRSEIKQVIREELQHTPQVTSERLEENSAKIQKCPDSSKDYL